jgi:hypothetical protein
LSTLSTSGTTFGWRSTRTIRADETYDPADVLCEPIPDGDDDKEELRLLRYGGEKRPLSKGTDLAIRGNSEGGFVTVRDFLSDVQPCLMPTRDGILEAMALDAGWPTKRPFRPETKLILM